MSEIDRMMEEMLGEASGNEAPASLTEITRQSVEIRLEVQKLEAQLKAVKAQQASVNEAILKTLDMMEIDKVNMHGFLFFKKRKNSVTTPKTPEEKEALFEFLKEEGIFLEIASVNSMTLNSLYKELAEKAAENGVLEFEMPGVGKPTEYITLEMRSAK